MATSLETVKRILGNYVKSDKEVFGERVENLDEYVLQGTSYAGVVLGKTYFSLVDCMGEVDLESIETPKMGNAEVRLAALCSYLDFALNFHHNLTVKATNFKSKSLSISGATEKAKEAMRIVWWIEGQIKQLLDLIDRVGIPDAEPPIQGGSSSFATVAEILFEDHHFVY